MTDRGSADDGSISDIPWASVFDPAINVRALGEIQARGFKAATELVDRFVRMSDRGGATEPNTEPAPAATTDRQDETRSATSRPDADRLLASWKGIIGQLTQSLRAVPSPADAGSAAFDLMNDNSTGRIAFEATQPGAVSTEVWLHNGGPTDLGKVWLRCSDLLAHDGTVIPAQMVRFEPDTVPMPPRCSRGVTVEVDVADELPPGCYRGTLLADGHPEVWLPIALTIKPQVS